MEELHNSQFKFNVICIQECWIRDQSDTCTFQIPGYDCVAQGKSSSERGGLITYVDNLFQYEVRQSINEYELWEGQIIYRSKEAVYVKKLLWAIYIQTTQNIKRTN